MVKCERLWRTRCNSQKKERETGHFEYAVHYWDTTQPIPMWLGWFTIQQSRSDTIERLAFYLSSNLQPKLSTANITKLSKKKKKHTYFRSDINFYCEQFECDELFLIFNIKTITIQSEIERSKSTTAFQIFTGMNCLLSECFSASENLSKVEARLIDTIDCRILFAKQIANNKRTKRKEKKKLQYVKRYNKIYIFWTI